MLNYSGGHERDEMMEFMKEHPKGDFIIMGADGVFMVWFDKGFDLEQLAHLLDHISLDLHSMLEEKRREAERN